MILFTIMAQLKESQLYLVKQVNINSIVGTNMMNDPLYFFCLRQKYRARSASGQAVEAAFRIFTFGKKRNIADDAVPLYRLFLAMQWDGPNHKN